MATIEQDNCALGSGENVELRYLPDLCGCPGDDPKEPVQLQKLDVGNRSINETRTTIEDPNAFGGTCTKSVSDGAEGDFPFTHCLTGSNQPILDVAMGSKQGFAPRLLLTDLEVLADGETYQSATFDFYANGLRPGMMLNVAGKATAANNGFKYVKTVDNDGTTPFTFTVYSTSSPRCPEYPLLVAEAAGTATLEGNFVTYKGGDAQNLVLERFFPNTLNSVGAAGVYQQALGGAIDEFDFTVTPGQFVTGNLSVVAPKWNGCQDNSAGRLVENLECGCDDKVLYDPNVNQRIDFFYGGELICIDEVSWTGSRTVNISKTSCGSVSVPGKLDVTGSFTTSFLDSTYLADKKNQTGKVLSVIFWNEARTQFENYSFTNITISDDSIDPDDEDKLFQENEFTANDNTAYPNSSPIFLQRSALIRAAVRNRVEFTTSAALDVSITGGEVGELVTVESTDANGTVVTTTATRTTTAAETFSFALPGGGVAPYTVAFYAPSDTAWTAVDTSDAVSATNAITSSNYCYIRPYVTSIVEGNNTATEQDFSNYPVLETLTLVNNDLLTNVIITNSHALTAIDVSGAALTEASVDAILAVNLASGLVGSSVDLDNTGGGGAGNSAPSATGAATAALLAAAPYT